MSDLVFNLKSKSNVTLAGPIHRITTCCIHTFICLFEMFEFINRLQNDKKTYQRHFCATLGGIHRKPSFWFPFCRVTNCAENPHRKESNSHEFQHCVTGLGERWSRLDHQKPKFSQLLWFKRFKTQWMIRHFRRIWIQHNPKSIPSSRPWTLDRKPRVHTPYNTDTTPPIPGYIRDKELIIIELDIITFPANHIEGFSDIHHN